MDTEIEGEPQFDSEQQQDSANIATGSEGEAVALCPVHRASFWHREYSLRVLEHSIVRPLQLSCILEQGGKEFEAVWSQMLPLVLLPISDPEEDDDDLEDICYSVSKLFLLFMAELVFWRPMYIEQAIRYCNVWGSTAARNDRFQRPFGVRVMLNLSWFATLAIEIYCYSKYDYVEQGNEDVFWIRHSAKVSCDNYVIMRLQHLWMTNSMSTL